MAPAFLAQFAAGCFLAVTVSAIRQTGWKYLRLMAVVSFGLTFLALVVLWREPNLFRGQIGRTPFVLLGTGLVLAIAWLTLNALQSDRVDDAQRIPPALAGLAILCAAIILSLQRDPLLPESAAATRSLPEAVAISASVTLGAWLLGSVTAAMLLGHRYLTDTDMQIAPLRRITRVYLFVVIVRSIWLAAASIPLWIRPSIQSPDAAWFWVVVTVRLGLGVVVVAIFGYMAWDCVRRRATQSATALFYLSMIFVFLGELAGQYLVRTESLPL